jgi:hypothetical protein
MFMNDPANNALDRIRIMIGDTDNDEILLSQQVLEYLYESTNKNEKLTAIKALEAIIMASSKYTDEVTGDVEVKLSQRFKQFRTVLNDLKKSTMTGTPYAGGISVSDIEMRRASPDAPRKSLEQGWSTSYSGMGC